MPFSDLRAWKRSPSEVPIDVRASRIDRILKSRVDVIEEMHQKALEAVKSGPLRDALEKINVGSTAFPTRRDRNLMAAILYEHERGSDSLPVKCLMCGGVASRIFTTFVGFSCCESCGKKNTLWREL